MSCCKLFKLFKVVCKTCYFELINSGIAFTYGIIKYYLKNKQLSDRHKKENELRTTVSRHKACCTLSWFFLGPPGLLVAGSSCCVVCGLRSLNAAFPCWSCLSYFIQETQNLLFFYFSLQNDFSDNRFKFWLLLTN
jgi:hypothetical protein